MKWKLVLAPCTILLALTWGCATTTSYYVDDQAYSDRSEAELAHRDLLRRTLLGIPPTESPIGGTALVVLPTRGFIDRNGINMMAGKREQLGEDGVQYVVGYLDRQLGFAFDTIEKRGVFDEVVLERSDSPESRDLGALDYLVYMHLPDSATDVGTWYVKGRDWTSPRIVPDGAGDAGPVQAARNRLDNLEGLLRPDRG